MGSGQSREYLFLVGLELYVDFDANVDYLDFKHDDSDIDADVEPGLVDLEDLAMVAGAEDRDVMAAGIE